MEHSAGQSQAMKQFLRGSQDSGIVWKLLWAPAVDMLGSEQRFHAFLFFEEASFCLGPQAGTSVMMCSSQNNASMRFTVRVSHDLNCLVSKH